MSSTMDVQEAMLGGVTLTDNTSSVLVDHTDYKSWPQDSPPLLLLLTVLPLPSRWIPSLARLRLRRATSPPTAHPHRPQTAQEDQLCLIKSSTRPLQRALRLLQHLVLQQEVTLNRCQMPVVSPSRLLPIIRGQVYTSLLQRASLLHLQLPRIRQLDSWLC